jgi:tetratricopeptide (TPR) repeat protein
MSKSQQTISLCMIVRNEERFIGQCLNSVKDFVDDLVVVDTGSEDSTIDIARAAGARIYRHPWTEDFSEARNHSIDHASSDWILVLDADEVLAARDAQQLQSMVRTTTAPGVKLIQRTYLRNANFVCASPNPRTYVEGNEYSDCLDVRVIRLFRNDGRIRYQGRVHELVEPFFEARRLVSETSDLVIHHFGKVGDATRLESKKRMYLDLGRRKAQEGATDALAQFELGVQLYEFDRFEECIPFFETSLKLNPSFDLALLYIAKACHESGQMERAGIYFQKCLKRGPENDKVLFDYANFVRDQGHFKAAIKVYQKALLANPRHSLALFNMGAIQFRTGETEKGLKSIERALHLNPDNASFYEHLGRLPLEGPSLQAAAQILEQYVDRFPGACECQAVLAEMCFKLKEFDRACKHAGGVLQKQPNHLGCVLVKANSEFSLGRLEEADGSYRCALSVAPEHLDSMMNLAAIAEHRGEHAAAASWYTRIIDNHPDQTQARSLALKRYVVASARSAIGEIPPGILEQACGANPDDLQCLLLAGGLLERAGHIARAAALYRNAGQLRTEWAAIVDRHLQRLGNSQTNSAVTPSGETQAGPISEATQQRRATSCPN